VECFNKAEELLEFATKGYLILVAMEILNLKSVDDVIDDSKEQLDTILSKPLSKLAVLIKTIDHITTSLQFTDTVQTGGNRFVHSYIYNFICV
jgi:hypothetical protein